MPINKSWHDYNESLIERGCVLIDLDFIRLYNEDIKNMNKNKVGAPFQDLDNYIQFLAFLKIGFKIPYLGLCREQHSGSSEYVRIEELHFTHIRRRILKIKPSVGA